MEHNIQSSIIFIKKKRIRLEIKNHKSVRMCAICKQKFEINKNERKATIAYFFLNISTLVKQFLYHSKTV